MDEATSRTRAFVCLGLSDPVRDAIGVVQEHLRRKGLALAYAHPRDAHLTLAFLGSIEHETIELLAPRLDEVAARVPPFGMAVRGGGFFGPPRAPRVAWIGVEETSVLMDLQAAVATTAEACGIALERRPFHPHLTLARIRAPLPPDALTLIKSSINNTTFGEVPVDRVLFMSSQPNGSGPRYKILHESPLKGTRQHG